MTTTLAIANQKGGVGKTTTAINLAASLAALEKRVLVVDGDPQGNATRGLGQEALEPHLYHLLIGECSVSKAIRATGFPNLDLLPSNGDLVGVEVEFVGLKDWEFRLREALAFMAGHYDVVLLDCPPSLGHLTVLSLVAADSILVPLQCEYFALEGLSDLLATVRRIQGRLNPSLGMAGVVLTMYDDRTNLSRQVADEIRKHFEDRVFRTIVPRNVRLAEAPSHGLPALQYDIRSRGAQAYLELARELVGADKT